MVVAAEQYVGWLVVGAIGILAAVPVIGCVRARARKAPFFAKIGALSQIADVAMLGAGATSAVLQYTRFRITENDASILPSYVFFLSLFLQWCAEVSILRTGIEEGVIPGAYSTLEHIKWGAFYGAHAMSSSYNAILFNVLRAVYTGLELSIRGSSGVARYVGIAIATVNFMLGIFSCLWFDSDEKYKLHIFNRRYYEVASYSVDIVGIVGNGFAQISLELIAFLLDIAVDFYEVLEHYIRKTQFLTLEPLTCVITDEAELHQMSTSNTFLLGIIVIDLDARIDERLVEAIRTFFDGFLWTSAYDYGPDTLTIDITNGGIEDGLRAGTTFEIGWSEMVLGKYYYVCKHRLAFVIPCEGIEGIKFKLAENKQHLLARSDESGKRWAFRLDGSLNKEYVHRDDEISIASAEGDNEMASVSSLAEGGWQRSRPMGQYSPLVH